MKDITGLFNKVYQPVKGLIIYGSMCEKDNHFVEAYDMDQQGKMINAHPLALNESQELAETLVIASQVNQAYLQSTGLLPCNLLHLRTGKKGFAIWYTPPQYQNLYFHKDLSIPDGRFGLPAMIWKADQEHLSVYALTDNKKPGLKSLLYHAPYFNVYNSGEVCMGTVDIEIDGNFGLEDFIAQWQKYFFNSKFSHVIGETSPVKVNIVQLWQGLHNNRKKFPVKTLVKHSITIKNLL